MWVDRGTQADWDLLSSLHYKMHSLPVGAKFYRLRFRGETIGVCVMGMSRPLLRERHAIFPLLRPGEDTQISNIHRYAYINDNFRVVGRIVVDTMFRSAGVAYRFLNLCARMHGYTFCEIQSSASKYNMFAQRAGFTMVKPIRSLHYEMGLKFMRRYFSAHPSDTEALMDEFSAMPAKLQSAVELKAKEFYFDHSPLEKTGSRRFYSKGVVDHWPMRRTLTKIQGLCFASPLYGIYRNPDAYRLSGEPKLPDVLPLLAFDLQPTSAALRVADLDAVKGWRTLQEKFVASDWRQPTKIEVVHHRNGEDDDEKEIAEAISPEGEGAINDKPSKKAKKARRKKNAAH
jgi:hypothetical protein